ncbi:hypothetical protein [Methylocapsa sp. S129]|uniref:hypothetical protein n=1 Tax=Methylocapsa sp. S129 TaxID=1641869 RepID=UPI00131E1349|nr:hypothetical protein [Methylocapsa sp. S129]
MSSKFTALCVGAAALLLLIGAGLFLHFGRGGAAPPTRQAFVGAARFTLLSGYFRPSSRDGGRLDRLDLAAFFPDFGPAGEAGDIDGKTDLAERYQRLVFITVTPADSSLDPAERPTKLYARFLEPDQWSHPGGLLASAFQAGSPFEGQELYFAAPEGRAFSARCSRPDQTQKTPNSCTYDFRVDGLDIELRFSAALLSEWEKLSAGARGLIEAARR